MAEKRGRGRPPGIRMTEEHRDKIRNSKILQVLIEHVEGQREMGATQVTAGVALLKKVLPDLAAMELTGADGGPVQTEDVSAREVLLAKLGLSAKSD